MCSHRMPNLMISIVVLITVFKEYGIRYYQKGSLTGKTWNEDGKFTVTGSNGYLGKHTELDNALIQWVNDNQWLDD